MADKQRAFREQYEAQIDALRRQLTDFDFDKDGAGRLLTDELSVELMEHEDFEAGTVTNLSSMSGFQRLEEEQQPQEELQSLLASSHKHRDRVNVAEKAEASVPQENAPCFSCFGLFKGHASG